MKVFVGMSGGVDSSLTAALLVEQGHDVTGIYMKNWTEDLPGMRCPWADDLADAKRVAVQLGIPFRVYDFQSEYKQKVVDYMLAEYRAGRTPNPDIMCNQEVKFKLFLDLALEEGADMIATGHYARVCHSDGALFSDPVDSRHDTIPKLSLSVPKRISLALVGTSQDNSATASGLIKGSENNAPSSVVLLKAVDEMKDQTYFLYRVTNQALSKTLFPLGEFTKPQVRKMAEERGLVTARKKDSQGICFVGSVGIKEFLSQYVTTKPGEVIEKETGKVISHHDGAIYYTIGQRHGLSLGGGLPYYVVGKDMDKNAVYVSRNLNDETMWRREVVLTDIHWINNASIEGDKLTARLRHRGKLIPVHFTDVANVQLDEPERAITSGQSVVIYRGDEVLGGGIVV